MPGPVWKPWEEIEPGEIRCTDPEVLDALAAIMVDASRRQQREQEDEA